MSYNRLSNLNLQFAPTAASSSKAPARKPKGNFSDAWAYLGMDEFMSAEAKPIRDKCREFAERINPLLYDYTEASTFPY